MSGNRYTEEQKSWYFTNIVQAGIPPRGKLALEMMKQEWGKAPSKATLQYWVNPNEKEKLRERTQKYRKENVNKIVGERLWLFRRHTAPKMIEVPIGKKARTRNRGLEKSLMFTVNTRITKFHAKGVKGVDKVLNKDCTFLSKDVLDFWQDSQKYNPETHDIICHVCGDSLNLINDTWHMDHINPLEGNTLENCSCTHSICNQVKSSLQVQDLLALAKKIVKYHSHT